MEKRAVDTRRRKITAVGCVVPARCQIRGHVIRVGGNRYGRDEVDFLPTGRGFAGKNGDDPPLQVQQVGGAFDQQRIAGCADPFARGFAGASPGECRAPPLADLSAGTVDEVGIAQQLTVRVSGAADGAHSV